MMLKLGLASYLIKTPSACYLQTVVYGERHFLAEVQGICRIVTSDRDRLAIDETIDRKWCAQILDFTKNQEQAKNLLSFISQIKVND